MFGFWETRYDKGVFKPHKVSKLKQIFDYTGFSYLWRSMGVVDDGCIKAAFGISKVKAANVTFLTIAFL